MSEGLSDSDFILLTCSLLARILPSGCSIVTFTSL